MGLTVLTAVAEGIEEDHGNRDLARGELSDVGYRSVYYSCIILSGIGLLLNVFAIKLPEAIRGSIWKPRLYASATTEVHSSHELQQSHT